MPFNSPAFLLLFVPLVAIGVALVPARLRVLFLLAISILFYTAEGVIPMAVLLATVLWTWSFGFLVRSAHSALAVVIGIAVPAFALFLFKYLFFVCGVVGVDCTSTQIGDVVAAYGLPAGISFYTFHAISYILDIRRGKIEKPPALPDYFLYIVFFPQLIAGPIIRFNDVGSQFLALRKRLPDIDYMQAIKLIAFGLMYKAIFADILHYWKDKYEFGMGAMAGIYSIMSYSMVIYYDFWGYSLMAIGIAALVGIELPRNFLEPYTSRSPKEFWRRWHVTLSFWLRDYVYLPLGGNQNYVRNILIVFALCGLWHGAGWNFIVWGLYHAGFVIVYHLLSRHWDRMPDPLAIAVTYIGVMVAWPLFYLDLPTYGRLLTDIVTPATLASPYRLYHWAGLVLVMAYTFFVREEWAVFGKRSSFAWNWPPALAALTFVCLAMLSFRRTFIYFQF